MVSKGLMIVWGALDFFLLVAGGLAIAFSILWRAPDLIRNLVMTDPDLTFGMVVGVFYIVTFVVSVGAIIQRNHVTIGLVALNWLLIVDILVTVIYGSTLWIRTLAQRDNFHKVWLAVTAETRVAIQDQLQCCGYFIHTEFERAGTFCANFDPVANNVTEFNFKENNKNPAPIPGCVDPFNKIADYQLNNTFSSVYGFVVVLVCLFIASLCVIKKRQEAERFRKIDAKRGGRGFV